MDTGVSPSEVSWPNNEGHEEEWLKELVVIMGLGHRAVMMIDDYLLTTCWGGWNHNLILWNKIWARVVKCQLFYKKKKLQTKFYPQKGVNRANVGT